MKKAFIVLTFWWIIFVIFGCNLFTKNEFAKKQQDVVEQNAVEVPERQFRIEPIIYFDQDKLSKLEPEPVIHVEDLYDVIEIKTKRPKNALKTKEVSFQKQVVKNAIDSSRNVIPKKNKKVNTYKILTVEQLFNLLYGKKIFGKFSPNNTYTIQHYRDDGVWIEFIGQRNIKKGRWYLHENRITVRNNHQYYVATLGRGVYAFLDHKKEIVNIFQVVSSD